MAEIIKELGKIASVELPKRLAEANEAPRNDGEYHVSVIIRFNYVSNTVTADKFGEKLAKLPEKLRERLQAVTGESAYHCIEYADALLDEDELKELWPLDEDGKRTVPTDKVQIALRNKVRELLKVDGEFIEYPFTTVIVSASDVLQAANITEGIDEKGNKVQFSSLYDAERKRAYPYIFRSRFGERSNEYCKRVGERLLNKNVEKLNDRTFAPNAEKGWEWYERANKQDGKKSTIKVPDDDDDASESDDLNFD